MVSYKSYCLECCSWDSRTSCQLYLYNTKNQTNIECKSQKWFPIRAENAEMHGCCLCFYTLSWISNWIYCAVQVVTLSRLNNLLFLKWVYCDYSNMGQICPWCTLEECWDESLTKEKSYICEFSLTSGEYRTDDFFLSEVHWEGQRNDLVSTTTTLYSRYRQLFQTIILLLDIVELSFTVQEYLQGGNSQHRQIVCNCYCESTTVYVLLPSISVYNIMV